MKSVKKAFEILKVVHSLGEADRMEIFQCFDGTFSWSFVKRAIGFLASEELIERHPPGLPDRGSVWRLTEKGQSVVDDWMVDMPTEEVPKS